jgi:hypothetical protein
MKGRTKAVAMAAAVLAMALFFCAPLALWASAAGGS